VLRIFGGTFSGRRETRSPAVPGVAGASEADWRPGDHDRAFGSCCTKAASDVLTAHSSRLVAASSSMSLLRTSARVSIYSVIDSSAHGGDAGGSNCPTLAFRSGFADTPSAEARAGPAAGVPLRAEWLATR
jgi:hypothetical protein